jgi:hypothetical protein
MHPSVALNQYLSQAQLTPSLLLVNIKLKTHCATCYHLATATSCYLPLTTSRHADTTTAGWYYTDTCSSLPMSGHSAGTQLAAGHWIMHTGDPALALAHAIHRHVHVLASCCTGQL